MTDGEKELWSNVIRQAVADYLKDPNLTSTVHIRRQIMHERDRAAQWLFSDEMGVGSLQWICDHLKLRIETVQEEAWKRFQSQNETESSYSDVRECKHSYRVNNAE